MPTQTAPPKDDSGTITSKQMRELHALLRDHGITGDASVHDYLNAWLAEHDDDQHPLASRADLSTVTAARIIRALRKEDVATAPGGLARALVAVQRDLPVVQKSKTANVPTKAGGSYSYTYADLADVTAAAMPLLAANGLAFSCCPRAAERGYELVGVLLHESGERLEGALPLHGNDPQQLGGALTYHRRYLLGCMLGIVTDDDVDGRQAVGAARTQQWHGPTTSELLGLIDAHAERAGVTYEQITAKWRAARGNLSLDDLDALEPWVVAELEASIAEYLLKHPPGQTPPADTPEEPGTDQTGTEQP